MVSLGGAAATGARAQVIRYASLSITQVGLLITGLRFRGSSLGRLRGDQVEV